ncbi:glycerophosphoryl diester phosphodiesterase [Rodentibacter pneumotropicus]|uniref:Glycerophosphoryl diester phosphodiesterase n=1 Tax=Rodentibacter pneumotropicus TaxID=758 RepID=A0A448MID2_9PAST|nr:glycerophosphoryl diester phosphodiesterase [Rodentibacter pneumotropicus]
MTENFKTKDGKQVAVYPNRFPLWKSHFKIHTFEDEIEFIQGLEKSTGKKWVFTLKLKPLGSITKTAKILQPKHSRY